MKKLLVAVLLSLVASFALAAGTVSNFVIMPDTPSKYASMMRPAPLYVDARSLAASTAESQTVPTGARFVIFSANCNFYANPVATATVPGDVTDGTASELNPAAWYLTGITTISVIAPSTCVITMAFYK